MVLMREGYAMNEDQRREYDALIRGIADQAEEMKNPEDDEEMLFSRVSDLSSKVDELRDLLGTIYS